MFELLDTTNTGPYHKAIEFLLSTEWCSDNDCYMPKNSEIELYKIRKEALSILPAEILGDLMENAKTQNQGQLPNSILKAVAKVLSDIGVCVKGDTGLFLIRELIKERIKQLKDFEAVKNEIDNIFYKIRPAKKQEPKENN